MSNIVLDSRQKKIISILIREDDFITIKDIAQEIDVSSRTVSRALKLVEKWLNHYHVPLIKRTRVGIKLDGTISEQNKLLEKLGDEKIYRIYSPKERELIIILELLEKKEVTKLHYFSSLFNVSNSTVSKDLNACESWLSDYDLRIIRKQGSGISLSGDERNIRKAIINLLYEYTDQSVLNQMVKKTIDESKETLNQKNEIRNRLLNLIDDNMLKKLEEVVDHGEKALAYDLADSAYIGLVVHLSIAIKRIKNGERIELKEEYLQELKTSNEFEIAKIIAIRLEKYFNVDIPESEVGYITMHLKGAKLRNGVNGYNQMFNQSESLISNYALTRVVLKMLHVVQDELDIDLKDDKALLVGLISHLRPAFNRLKMDMKIRNPLLEQVQSNYPDIYSISKKASVVLEGFLEKSIPDSEVGYIAMHIGAAIEKKRKNQELKYKILVTCASGMGTSNLLASKINGYYDDLTIVASTSTRQIDKHLKKEKIDFIISTVKLEDISVPSVKVTPLLLEQDKEAIESLIEKIQKTKIKVIQSIKEEKQVKEIDFQGLNAGIYKVLKNFFVEEWASITDKNDLIKKISEKLSETDEECKELERVFTDREYIQSTIVTDKNLLLLHGKTDHFNKLVFGVIRLKEGIEEVNYKDEKVIVKNILVMVANSHSSHSEINILSHISESLIENDDFLKSILKDSKNILEVKLINLLNDYMRKLIS